MNPAEQPLQKNDTDMPVLEHIGELRRRLLKCIAAVGLAFGALAFAGPERILNVISAPVRTEGVQFIYLGLADALYVQLKAVFLCAVVLASPVLLWQLWSFVKPALYPEERKPLLGVALLSLDLFVIGIAFGYGIVFLSAIHFFIYAGAGTALPLLAIDRYVNFLVSFVIPFGLLFEMPLIAAALARTGLIHAETLRQGRRFAVLISFIVSALLTPPDVMSQVMMAIPSILLFECSIRCAAWAEQSYKQETATLTVNG